MPDFLPTILPSALPVPVALTSTFAAADPYLPPALFNSSACDTLRSITDRVPAALTRRTYLECRLADAVSHVDLELCVDASSRFLLGEALHAWAPPHLRAHPLWSGLARLCSEWGNPNSEVAPWIHDLWLEFDSDIRSRRPLVPSVFVGLVRDTSPPSQLWDAGRRCLEVATSRRVPPAIAAAVDRVVAKLPHGAVLPYVGQMYPRGARAIRLCIGRLTGAELLDYIAAVGWPGEIEGLRTVLRSLPCGASRHALDATTLLHLDVSEEVQPRIGFEVALAQYPQVVNGIIEGELLDALCAYGFCSPAKRGALHRWPGSTVERFDHQCWPSVALRRVSHVKLVWDRGCPIEAKVYLSFFHQFLRRWERLRRHHDSRVERSR